MNVPSLSENFDCALEVDEDDKPQNGIVLLGSPVGTDDFISKDVFEKAEKVDAVLDLARALEEAQIALLIHRACLSVVLFTHIFRTTSPSQTTRPALALDAHQARWLYRLLPALPSLTSAAVDQSRLPISSQGMGPTAPSDVVLPAYIGSRLDTAQNLAVLRRPATVDNKIAACETLLTEHANANNDASRC